MTPYYDRAGVTLFCGDAREILPSIEADVLVIDPPYGMDFQSQRKGAFGKSRIEADGDTGVRDSILARWGDRPALVFGRWSVARPATTRMVLTWDKGEHVGMGDLSLPWKPNTEEIYVLGSGFTGHRGGSVLRCNAIAGTVGQAKNGTRHHPTEKPEGLLRLLLMKCLPTWIIVDATCGSGTTLCAAKSLGRRAIGIEISEDYCRIAVERLRQDVLL